MSVNNDNNIFWDSSGSDIMEEDNSLESEQRVIMRREEVEVIVENGTRSHEKRKERGSSDDMGDEEGFTTVGRKKFARSLSRNPSGSDSRVNEILPQLEEESVVCVSGKEVLPKQFKMAKLLQSENILNISSIQYKSPYKILIQFGDKKSAQKLIECKKILDLDIRCHYVNEISVSYGVIKNVDLDVDDEEIMKNIESDLEIVSIKRLKRINSSGKWIDSETIRISFKASTLPQYVSIYGCRFKVEPYMFPVTQCSGCWKFGHIIRTCPSGKIVCPKCGENHPNCDTTRYICINCKGEHMALNKSCPVFIKEKKIRCIMRDMNCTYRKALAVYLEKNEAEKKEKDQQIESYTTNQAVHKKTNSGKSYRDILITQKNTQKVDQEISEDEGKEKRITSEESNLLHNKRKNGRQRSRNRNSSLERNSDIDNNSCDEIMEENINQDLQKKFSFKSLFEKAKCIIFSESDFENKSKSLLTLILKEFVKFISTFIRDNNICAVISTLFNYG